MFVTMVCNESLSILNKPTNNMAKLGSFSIIVHSISL